MHLMLLTPCFKRWKNSVYEVLTKPAATYNLAVNPTELNAQIVETTLSDYELKPEDKKFALFLGVLTLFPALLVAQISHDDVVFTLKRFFTTPLDFVIQGFLMSILLMAGAHFNKKPKPYSFAFNLMLKNMSLYPLLVFLTLLKWGAIPIILVLGVLAVRSAHYVYEIPLRNCILFYGMTYAMFAILQIQRI